MRGKVSLYRVNEMSLFLYGRNVKRRMKCAKIDALDARLKIVFKLTPMVRTMMMRRMILS